MRLPKFRVWKNNEKYYQDGIFFTKESDPEIEYSFEELFFDEDCIVEQYTGVTDIYEEEIYEGDIVWLRYSGSLDNECERNRFQIIFEHGSFCMKPIKLALPTSSDMGGGGNCFFSHLVYILGDDEDGNPIYKYELPSPQSIYRFRCMVVMGNIHENPELLENESN